MNGAVLGPPGGGERFVIRDVVPVRAERIGPILAGVSAQTVATTCATLLLLGVPAGLAGLAVPAFRRRVARFVMPATALVPVLAMAGSLYFSERAGFVPCELCWYQRIAMYPLAVIMPIAAFRRDRSVLPYVSVVAAIGLAISAYHVYIQAFPEESNFCEITNPCSATWVEAYGWLTIPWMAGLSFVVFLLGVATMWRLERDAEIGGQRTEAEAVTQQPEDAR